METIQLEIGLDLVPYVKAEFADENLICRIRHMRAQLGRAGSRPLPPIRVCDNSSLPPRGYAIFIRAHRVAGGELDAGEGSAALSARLEEHIRSYRTAL